MKMLILTTYYQFFIDFMEERIFRDLPIFVDININYFGVKIYKIQNIGLRGN